jgi:hypothetical protein
MSDLTLNKSFKKPRVISKDLSNCSMNDQQPSETQTVKSKVNYPGFKLASDKKIELSKIGKEKMLQVFQEFDLSDISINFNDGCEQEVLKENNASIKNISNCIQNNDQDLLHSEDDTFLSAIDFESIISDTDYFE